MPARLLGNFDFQSGRNAEPCSARRQTSGVFAEQGSALQPGATLRFVGNKLCFVTNHMQNKLPLNDLLELPLARPDAVTIRSRPRTVRSPPVLDRPASRTKRSARRPTRSASVADRSPDRKSTRLNSSHL